MTKHHLQSVRDKSWGAPAEGTNLQNVTESLRRLFISDPGRKMAYIDLEQAESRAVALIVYQLFGDRAYHDACNSGDPHTLVCSMVWPNKPWPSIVKAFARDTSVIFEDEWLPAIKKAKKEIAEQTFYRHYTYRDMAKRGGHGTNYYGKPRTMAMHLKVETKLMEDFQDAYFAAFPGIRDWHRAVQQQLADTAIITTPLGRQRQFFGRRRDDTTLREAIAFGPQSMVGDYMNLGIYRLWQIAPQYDISLHAQVHDAVLMQYPQRREAEYLEAARQAIETEFKFDDLSFIIPTEAASGWNWAYESLENPNGLRKWSGSDDRKRVPERKPKSAATSMLDRIAGGAR